MTKADIVAQVSDKTGIEKAQVLATVEAYMEAVKDALSEGENVYFRGFGSLSLRKELRKLVEIFQKTPPSSFQHTTFQHLNLLKHL